MRKCKMSANLWHNWLCCQRLEEVYVPCFIIRLSFYMKFPYILGRLTLEIFFLLMLSYLRYAVICTIIVFYVSKARLSI